MVTNRAVPVTGVLPEIYYRDADEALTWLARVYGFTENYRVPEDDGRIHTSQVQLGDAYVMIRYEREGEKSAASAGTRTHALMVIVDDVDAHFARAKSEGATIISDLTDEPYGTHEYITTDLDGNRWVFAENIKDMNPHEMFG